MRVVQFLRQLLPEIVDQAQYEQYCWAVLEGNAARANTLLGKLLQQGRARATRTSAFWLALYRQIQMQAAANVPLESMQASMQEFLAAYAQRKPAQTSRHFARDAHVLRLPLELLLFVGVFLQQHRFLLDQLLNHLCKDTTSRAESQEN